MKMVSFPKRKFKVTFQSTTGKKTRTFNASSHLAAVTQARRKTRYKKLINVRLA